MQSNFNIEPVKNEKTNLLQRFRQNQLLMAVFLTLIIFIVGAVINFSFISPTNIGSILSMAVLLGFAAAGQTIVVLSGGEGIDLSVGAVMSLGAVIAAEVMKGQNGNILTAVILVIIAGALVGLVNGAGVIFAHLPPLVMTLAVSNVVITIQLIYTHGTPSGAPAKMMSFLGTARLLPILPWLVIIGVLSVLVIEAFLKHTTYGKELYAIGSNFNASYLSGIKVSFIRGMAYVISGILSALAGFWLVSYNNFVFVNMGVSYGLASVAAVVIGGTSLAGGEGSFKGSMIGAVVLTALGSLLVVLNTDEAGRQIINGIVLIVLLGVYTRQPSIRQ